MKIEGFGLLILIVLLFCNFIIILVRDFISSKERTKKKYLKKDLKFFLKSCLFFLISLGTNALIAEKQEFLTKILGDFALVIWSITIYFGMLYLMMAVLTFLIMFNKWLKDRFNKEKNDYDDKLSYWIGENYISEKFLFKLFDTEDGDSEYNDIENIKKVRKILEKYLKEDKLNYKLLKNHLEFKRKNEFKNKLKFLLLPLIPIVSTALILPNITEYSEMLNKKIKEIINENGFEIVMNLFTTMAGFSLIIIFISLIFSIYLFCRIVYEVFTEKDRSVKYLITIIDIILEEI